MQNFLNLSEASSIAIHCLTFVGMGKGFVSASHIAEKTKFSRNHIAKILLLLAKNNYLESERGPSGGFKLKKDPSEINLLEVINVITGLPNHKKCSHHSDVCYFDHCVFGDIIERTSSMASDYFKNRTIAHIISLNKEPK